jgi:CRISPR system Cascade subunit CasE
MFLSKLILRSKEAIFKNVYDAHQALWDLFGDRPDRERDFLFREIDPVTYLALSAREPVDAKGVWRLAVKPYAPKLAVGDRLYVSLRANAVVKRKGPDGRQDRFDVVQDARTRFKERGEPAPSRAELAQKHGAQWLLARQDALGLCFEAQSLVVESYMVRRYWRGGHEARFGTLDFAGFAEVFDADKAFGALCKGVGPAKGFGCGLLLARRA